MLRSSSPRRGLWSLFSVLWLVPLGGCFFTDDCADEYDPPDPECETNDDCEDLDNDDSSCTVAECVYGSCQVSTRLDASAGCECTQPADCVAAYGQQTCSTWSCVDDTCVSAVAPAGLAPPENQVPGDCASIQCDGTAPNGVTMQEPLDPATDNNDCTADACGPDGATTYTPMEDGALCGSNGVCNGGACVLNCIPDNPDSCGSEGPGEPTNDAIGGAQSLVRYGATCGFLDGDDTDWWTFYGDDDTLVTDIFDASVDTEATSIELCVYVQCSNGTNATGDCTGLASSSENGLAGCCWTGDPSTFNVYWDMQCLGTEEDSGQFYVSVRAPGGGACEPYVLTAGY
ncbi:MAG: hypothetical protein HOW73_39155 [Polyangiaceae bacterium]|nr:hypothetical protein [Polyangiaceae bacterium]